MYSGNTIWVSELWHDELEVGRNNINGGLESTDVVGSEWYSANQLMVPLTLHSTSAKLNECLYFYK